MSDPTWEKPDVVAKFADRDPDLRLLELLDDYDDPGRVRVLDLGCAGGRNSELLARRGFDLLALDASRAMVAHTRDRLAPIVGESEAERRVCRGRIDDLSAVADGSVDLVVALGIYHCAESRAEWVSAISETARVLRSDGLLLLAMFTPETDLTGEGVRAVPGQPGVYEGLPAGRSVLLDQSVLDAEVERLGLLPAVPSRTVRVATSTGHRVTVNALYRLRSNPAE